MDSLIICGSQRKNSQSIRMSKILQEVWSSLGQSSEIVELAEENIPYAMSDWTESEKERWNAITAKVKAANSLIVVTPEWGGMATPMIKNFLLLCDHHLVGHKPCLLVAVSGGTGGAYPIAEIRATSFKNNKICFIPDHLILRDASNLLNNNPEKEAYDEYITRRIVYTLNVLMAYNNALKSVREHEMFFIDDYQYGM